MDAAADRAHNQAVDIRGLCAGLLVAAAVSGCGGGSDVEAEPARTVTVTAEPEPPAPSVDAPADGGAIDPHEWCADWWEQVVEETNLNSATGAVFLLVGDGVNVDDELISDRSAILDPYDDYAASETEIEQAIDDIGLACAVYIATGD